MSAALGLRRRRRRGPRGRRGLSARELLCMVHVSLDDHRGLCWIETHPKWGKVGVTVWREQKATAAVPAGDFRTRVEVR
jgi:hypothetical protein